MFYLRLKICPELIGMGSFEMPSTAAVKGDIAFQWGAARDLGRCFLLFLFRAGVAVCSWRDSISC